VRGSLKDVTRGGYQPFILVMQIATLVAAGSPALLGAA
jgi:hypothetical protein